MNFRIFSISLFVLFYCQNCLNAQTETTDQPKVKKEDQTFLLKFDPARVFLYEGQTRNYTRAKINEFGLGLERKIAAKSTLEFEIGATQYDYAYQPFSSDENDQADEYYFNLNYGITSKVGWFTTLAYRYYLTKSALQGFYISPKFRYRLLSDQVYPIVDYQNMAREERHREFFYMLNIGFQQWMSDSFTLDFYVGAGILYKVGEYNHCYWSYNPPENSSVLNWTNTPYQSLNPNICLGVKIGFGKR